MGQRTGGNVWPMNTRTLRNVTAIGTGEESHGILFDITTANIYIDVKSTIAKGTAMDVEAVSSGSSSASVITLEASDFATAKAVSKNEGTASVTDPGTDGNITEPPLLAVDQFHELPGSPTVDMGVLDESSGLFDIDGGSRVVGGGPDMGADEILAPTTTTVACLPVGLRFGQELTCSATVEAADAIPLAGAVDLAIESAGGQARLASCELSAAGPHRAECNARFPVMALGPDMPLTATYSGDSSHAVSEATLRLGVQPVVTTTDVTCASPAIVTGHSTNCVATVSNVDVSVVAPMGKVTFQSTGSGIFLPGSTCVLVPIALDKTQCQFTYSPAATRAGSHQISVSYSGDEGHLGSNSAAFRLYVMGPTPPNTRLKHRPAHRTSRRRAVFVFASNEGEARFQCKLDGKSYRSCHSPFRATVSPGRHIFRVRAAVAGLIDTTPVVFRWKVLH